jgi:hypothetical protein
MPNRNTQNTEQPNTIYGRPTCHHVFPDNHRCGSPALRGERFCYYHHPSRKPVANPRARLARRGFHLAAPRNHADLQQALGEVITRLAAKKLDVHRAGLLLYSLQIAGRHLPSSTT